MKAEQIIYTSCRRGISGTSSGFQNYSYSPEMGKWINSGDAIGLLQSYQPPRQADLPALPSKEEAQSLFPRREFFGPLEGPDHLFGMALCSYIGRDYPEGSVRGGNFISHVLALPIEQVKGYPCEYIDSASFLTWMDANLARSQTTPDPLPSLSIESNPNISLQAVQDFLEDDRSDVFELMLRCLLTRNEGGYPHKLVIVDDKGNFALWVAALEYALPVRQARSYAFSSYEYDLQITPAVVVRAVKGCLHGIGDASMAYNFVFNFETGELPAPPDANEDVDAFCEFAASALCYAPDSLSVNNSYLDATEYSDVDARVGTGYILCQLAAGTIAAVDCTSDQISRGCSFLVDFGTPEQCKSMVDSLIESAGAQVMPKEWTGAVEGGIQAIGKAQPNVAAHAATELLKRLKTMFTASNVSEDLYQQNRSLAQILSQVTGRDLNVELFRLLTEDGSAALDLGQSNGQVPWTVRAYASILSSSLLSSFTQIGGLPQGVSGQEMLASLGRENAAAVNKLVTSLATSSASTGSAIFESLVSQWGQDPALVSMLGFLVAEARPTAKDVENLAVARLWQIFLQEPEPNRINHIASLLKSGRTDVALDHLLALGDQSQSDPVPYYRFLAQLLHSPIGNFIITQADALLDKSWSLHGQSVAWGVACLSLMSQLPGMTKSEIWQKVQELDQQVNFIPNTQSQAQDAQTLEKFCSETGLAIPDHVNLCMQALRLSQLAQAASNRRRDQILVDALCKSIRQAGPKLAVNKAGNQLNAYIEHLAISIAPVATESRQIETAWMQSMPMQTIATMLCQVLRQVAALHNETEIMLLLATYLPYVSNKSRHVLIQEGPFINFAAQQMGDAGFKSSSINKMLEDDRQLNKLIDRYQKRFGSSFNSGDFRSLLLKIHQKMQANEKQDGRGGFFSMFRR